MQQEKSANHKEEIAVAVVGAGAWGGNLLRNFHEMGALKVVCDIDPKKLGITTDRYPECRGVGSFAEVLKDDEVHAVAISTPSESHAELVREALLAGKDVFVEKPLCLAAETGGKLVSLAAQRGLVLMVGHLLWYHPAVVKLKELVDGGELGRVRYIYSNRLNLGRIRREENILWSFAPHDISVILGLLSEMPDSVRSQGGYYLHQQIADVTVSLLSFPSGIRAHIFVSWLHPFKEQKLVVVGDRKMAVFDDMEPTEKLLLYPHSIHWQSQIPIANKAEAEAIDFEWEEPLRAECRHFLECIATRGRPRTDGEEGLRVLEVLEKCQESLSLEAGRLSMRATRQTPPYFVHESSYLDEGVDIGQGTSIWHFSHVLRGSRVGKNCRIGQNVVIGPNVTIGEGVKIQNNVSVYEGVTLEDYVFCGPSMVFTNVINPRSEVPRMNELKPTRVRKGATLGANSTILCGIEIGRYAFIAAGAVVSKDVPDRALVAGNPARIQGWMCDCGVKLPAGGNELQCPSCSKIYEKVENRIQPIAERGRGDK